VIFAASAAVVWIAGTRLARYAKAISERSGAGQGFIGTVLLGVVASFPEMTMAATAALIGNAPLAINLLLGGARSLWRFSP
jgi:cation:H+ antiporter